MKCVDYRNMFQDHIEGILDRSESARLEEHVASCPRCAAELEKSRRLFALLDGLDTEEAPAGFEERVMERVRREILPAFAAGKIAGKRRSVYGALLFAVVLVLVFPLFLLRGSMVEVLGSIVVHVGEILVNLKEFVANLDVVYRLLEILGRDVHLLGTVLEAVGRAIGLSGEGFIATGLMLLLLFVLGAYLFKRVTRRRYENASFCF